MNIPLFSTCWMMMIKSWRILDTVSFACITSYFVKQLSTHKQRAQTTRTNNAHPPRYIQVIYCYINYFLKVNKLIALLTLLLVYPAYKHFKKKNTNSLYYLYPVYIYIYRYFTNIFTVSRVSLGITRYHRFQLRPERSFAPHGVGLAALHSRPAAWPRDAETCPTCPCRVLGAGRPHQGRWQRLTLSVSDAHSDHSGHGRSVWKNHEKP